MDEAVLRIVLEDAARGGSAQSQGSISTGTSTLIGTNTPAALERRQTKEIVQALDSLGKGLGISKKAEAGGETNLAHVLSTIAKLPLKISETLGSTFNAITHPLSSLKELLLGKKETKELSHIQQVVENTKPIQGLLTESNKWFDSVTRLLDDIRQWSDHIAAYTRDIVENTKGIKDVKGSLDLIDTSTSNALTSSQSGERWLEIIAGTMNEDAYRVYNELNDIQRKSMLESKVNPGMALSALTGKELGVQYREAYPFEEVAKPLPVPTHTADGNSTLLPKRVPIEEGADTRSKEKKRLEEEDFKRRKAIMDELQRKSDVLRGAPEQFEEGKGPRVIESEYEAVIRKFEEDWLDPIPGAISSVAEAIVAAGGKLIEVISGLISGKGTTQPTIPDTTAAEALALAASIPIPSQESQTTIPDTPIQESPEEHTIPQPAISEPPPRKAPETGIDTSPMQVEEEFHLSMDEPPTPTNRPSNFSTRKITPQQEAELARWGVKVRNSGTAREWEVKQAEETAENAGQKLEYFASGGWVGDHPGGPKGTDTIPAWLSEGEFVVNAQSAAKNRPQLEEMNAARGMARGGLVRYMGLGGAAFGGALGYMTGGAHGAGRGAVRGGVGGMMLDATSTVLSTSSDPAQALGDLGKSVSSAGASLSKFVPVVGGAVQAAGELTSTFASLISSVGEAADKYGQYSPEIAQAQAMAEITQTLGDMSRAQEASGELAEFVTAKADLQQKFEDIKIKFIKKITPIVTRIMEVIELIMPAGEAIANTIAMLLEPLGQLVSLVNEWVGNSKPVKEKPLDPTTQLFSDKFEKLFGDDGWVPKS